MDLLTKKIQMLLKNGLKAGVRHMFPGRGPGPVTFHMSPKKSRLKILFLAWYDPQGLGTILENVKEVCRLSRFHFEVLNLYDEAMEIPSGLNYYKYDALMIHCTLSYNIDNLRALDGNHPRKIKDFPGLKVMMKQDEHYRTDGIVQYLQDNAFDLLFTCVPSSEIEKVYPKEKFPRLKFHQMLTGYVTDEMRKFTFSQDEDRPLDIGYRGSLQPWSFGRLSYEKQQIGDVFLKICRERNLTCDISSRWEDRFFGNEWFRFLGGCKATLGVESGASIFDFTGQVERESAEYLKQNPKADFEEVFRKILEPYEGNVYYNQISPRHFEAAACRTVQILYEGQYSDIFQPFRHYLPLKRDLSNLDDILARLQNAEERKSIAQTAFQEIIMNDKYKYSTFVTRLDEEIDALI
ncbi:MAG: glycosyltransferase family 1 protein [Nitrospirae bacterium]|nr:glycosyltransferase family 1 protein [Nitrospirota bacterium]